MSEVTKPNRATSDKIRNEAPLLPPVDVVEDTTGITLTADLPGVPKDKLTLQVDANTLTIEGEVLLETPQNMHAMHADVQVPRYRRVFTLSKELDGDQVSAQFKDGVLTLRLPKAQHAQPRKIAINVS